MDLAALSCQEFAKMGPKCRFFNWIWLADECPDAPKNDGFRAHRPKSHPNGSARNQRKPSVVSTVFDLDSDVRKNKCPFFANKLTNKLTIFGHISVHGLYCNGLCGFSDPKSGFVLIYGLIYPVTLLFFARHHFLFCMFFFFPLFFFPRWRPLFCEIFSLFGVPPKAMR